MMSVMMYDMKCDDDNHISLHKGICNKIKSVDIFHLIQSVMI